MKTSGVCNVSGRKRRASDRKETSLTSYGGGWQSAIVLSIGVEERKKRQSQASVASGGCSGAMPLVGLMPPVACVARPGWPQALCHVPSSGRSEEERRRQPAAISGQLQRHSPQAQ